MVRSVQPGDDTFDSLAMQLARTAVAALDEAGVAPTLLNKMKLVAALRKALERADQERERAVRQERIDRRTAWVDGHGLLAADAMAQYLGLSLQELATAQALAVVVPVEIPLDLRATSDHFTRESWQYYRPNQTLTKEECAQIVHATLLTRAQAAQRLGVRPLAFDQLRAQHGVTPASQTCRPGETQLNRYHTDDVDRLVAATQHA